MAATRSSAEGGAAPRGALGFALRKRRLIEEETAVHRSVRLIFIGFAALSIVGAVHAQGVDLYPQKAKSPDRDPRDVRPNAPDDRQYQYGREIYAVKLGCDTCPLGGKPLDEATARRFLSDDTLWEGLTDKEEDAVSVYLRQLYAIR